MAAEGAIYLERQYGGLCGLHSLNNLLQMPCFKADDLADIAHTLDVLERHLLEDGAGDGSSNNVDDAGNFSIQVLAEALDKSYNLKLIRDSSVLNGLLEELNNEEIDLSSRDVAFLCNLKEHWFVIRTIRGEFYNLNSLSKRPKKISLFYLSAYLGQLREEGYSIFVVEGNLPPLLQSIEDMGARSDWFIPGVDDQGEDDVEIINPDEVDDPELRMAIRASLASSKSGQATAGSDTVAHFEDEDLAQAIAMSLSEQEEPKQVKDVDDDDDEDDEDQQVARAIKESLKR